MDFKRNGKNLESNKNVPFLHHKLMQLHLLFTEPGLFIDPNRRFSRFLIGFDGSISIRVLTQPGLSMLTDSRLNRSDRPVRSGFQNLGFDLINNDTTHIFYNNTIVLF